MGLGIGAMHYIGMAAMVVDAELSYATGWVVLSFIIAISAATVALWLSGRGTSLSGQALSAAAMGVAISGMHYVAMIGAHFTPLDDAMSATHGGDRICYRWLLRYPRRPSSFCFWAGGLDVRQASGAS